MADVDYPTVRQVILEIADGRAVRRGAEIGPSHRHYGAREAAEHGTAEGVPAVAPDRRIHRSSTTDTA